MSIDWFWRKINLQTNFVANCLIVIFIYINIVICQRFINTLQNKNDFKYQIKIQLAEHNHVTIECPEIEKESRVEWFKDNKLLNSSLRNNMDLSEEEPHITIDAYNSLYILHATRHEEGTYACNVDGEKMQKFYVIIVSKSRLLNQDFIRFAIYLGFVLSLTLICYCVGIYLAWHRRASFADPLNLYKQQSRIVRNM